MIYLITTNPLDNEPGDRTMLERLDGTSYPVSFPLSLREGHLLSEDSLLWDTGSPVTVTREEEGKYLGASLDELSEQLFSDPKPRLDALVGTDVLGRAPVEFDLRAGTLTFGATKPNESEACRFRLRGPGAPVASARLDGKKIWAYWDTGAPTSYVRSSLWPQEGEVTRGWDFFPACGKFKTRKRDATVDFFGLERLSLTVPVSTLPDKLEQSLLTTCRVDMVLGPQLLGAGRVYLDLREGEMWLTPCQ